MALQFGVFDHIEPVPGLDLEHIYAQRLMQIERLDAAGFYAYHLAEHHTPAVHSLAPSQNVFLAAVSQRTTHLRFGPCVYVLPLHHPVRLVEESSMLDNLSLRVSLGALDDRRWVPVSAQAVASGMYHPMRSPEAPAHKTDAAGRRCAHLAETLKSLWHNAGVKRACVDCP